MPRIVITPAVRGSDQCRTDRVRTGRLLILLGSGAGFVTLLLFLLANLRREEFSYLVDVLPALLGVAIGVVARFRAKAAPIV